VGRDRRRRALPRHRRHADRQGEGAGDLLQRRVRRARSGISSTSRRPTRSMACCCT
jgi:hypothetical protein